RARARMPRASSCTRPIPTASWRRRDARSPRCGTRCVGSGCRRTGWRGTSAGRKRRGNTWRSTSASGPLHEPHLEAVRERSVPRIRADAVLELAAKLRGEVDRVLLLVALASGGLQEIALRLLLRKQRRAHEELDLHVLGREAVELQGRLEADLLAIAR